MTPTALDKLANRYAALEAIADAASEYLAARLRYEDVSEEFEDIERPKWRLASRDELDALSDLRMKVDALAKIENP